MTEVYPKSVKIQFVFAHEHCLLSIAGISLVVDKDVIFLIKKSISTTVKVVLSVKH